MVDPDVELRISRRLEAGVDHRVPRGVRVLHEEIDVAVRACQRILVVLGDLRPLHQHDRALHGCEHALEHKRGDQRRRGRSALRGDRMERGRSRHACGRLCREQLDAVKPQVGLARGALDQTGKVGPKRCVVHDLLVIRRCDADRFERGDQYAPSVPRCRSRRSASLNATMPTRIEMIESGKRIKMSPPIEPQPLSPRSASRSPVAAIESGFAAEMVSSQLGRRARGK